MARNIEESPPLKSTYWAVVSGLFIWFIIIIERRNTRAGLLAPTEKCHRGLSDISSNNSSFFNKLICSDSYSKMFSDTTKDREKVVSPRGTFN